MDFVLLTGDQALFDASFPPVTVIAPPGTITGSGRSMINGVTVCVQGDETTVVVAGAAYVAPGFAMPGVGILTITGLAPDQVSTKDQSGGRPVLLKGGQFTAQLQVVGPASNPVGPPDSVPVYTGTGTFVTVNAKVRAA